MADQKLKEAAAEIASILKKHDIAGHVILVSKTHAEFMFKLDPTWSAIRREGDHIRIKAVKAELGSNKVVKEKMELTAHILCQVKDLTAQGFGVADRIIAELEKNFKIEHKSFSGFEPHLEN